jgi:outer membrane protein assembly factor BamA
MKYFLPIFFVFLCVQLAAQPISIEVRSDSTQNTKEALKLGERVKIQEIKLFGNKKTRRNIILRELSLKEGETILSDSLDMFLEINRKRLQNISLFTDVNLYLDKLDDSTLIWDIYVKEQWYLLPEVAFQLADRNFNVWWTEQNRDIRRANLRLTLKNRNFRGNMESLSATVQVGYTQKFALDYFKPYIDRSQKHGVGASFSLARNEETFFKTDSNKLKFVRVPRSYITRQVEGALTYVYRPGYTTKHLFELRYKDWQINDTIAKLNTDYLQKGSTELKMLQFLYRLEINKVDNWNYPMEGSKLVGYGVIRKGFEGMKFQAFVQTESGYFKKFGKRWYTSNILRGRLTVPEDQPYILRNALGTESEYVRGYEYYVIDGSQYGVLRNNIKYEALNIKIRNLPLKYLPVIPLRLYPKVFLDAGYVQNKFAGNSMLNNRWLVGYGAGIDIVSAYDFKLRVEYTWNHLGEKGLFLHLSSE